MTELYKLTGFQGESEIAEVLFENPRAYMALRGAIAEKHLEKLLEQWKANGDIREFRAAAGDFDKDFYIETI